MTLQKTSHHAQKLILCKFLFNLFLKQKKYVK